MRSKFKGDTASADRAITIGFVGMACFLLSWLYVALHFIPAMEGHDPKSVSSSALSSSQSTQYVNEKHNLWEGWQPLSYKDDSSSNSQCSSWRSCFKEDHGCPGLCRDSKQDWNIDRDDAHVPNDWVPDVTMLRRMMLNGKDQHGHPWPPPLDRELCEPMNSFGDKHGDINKDLLDAVPIRGMALTPSTQKVKEEDVSTWTPKIMCMIYTMASAHPTKIRAIRETWAGGCDGFLAFSTESDPRIPAISIPHQGPEEYDNMWQKVRSIFAFVGKHYLEDFDFFFQGGDDLYVLPGNLRHYIKHAVADPEQDFFAGRRFRQTKDLYFNSGGAGYVISRGTLRKYVTQGINHTRCSPNRETSQEDVEIAQCLGKVFDIGLIDTRDEQGRERFHPFAPGTHYTWKPPKPPERDWYQDYNLEWPVQLGKDCCAPDSVSFHYVKKPAMVRHLHSLLYYCDNHES